MLTLNFGKGVRVIFCFSSFWRFFAYSLYLRLIGFSRKIQIVGGLRQPIPEAGLSCVLVKNDVKKIRKGRKAIVDIGKINSIM